MNKYINKYTLPLMFQVFWDVMPCQMVAVMTLKKKKKKRVPLPLRSNLSDPEDGDTTLLCNDDNYLPADTKEHLRSLEMLPLM
jgi:hypothetical protein